MEGVTDLLDGVVAPEDIAGDRFAPNGDHTVAVKSTVSGWPGP
jgi:hypothetical protein